MAAIFELSGVVERGRGMGRHLGFPTANIKYDEAANHPPDGVYAARAWVGGAEYRAVLNQGRHPTIPGGSKTIEVHLIGYEGDMYGQTLRIEYLRFLRPEKKFDSPEALRLQLQQDIQSAFEE